MKTKRYITNDWIATPAGWTPYDGMQVQGWPIATIVDGKIVMQENEIQNAPAGRLVHFQH